MWWIGALIGLALGLASDYASALWYTIFGAVFGLLIKISLDSQFSALKKANMTLHEQAAAAMKDLRATIAKLEEKIKSLEAELQVVRSAKAPADSSVTSTLDSVTATHKQAETSGADLSSTTTSTVATRSDTTSLDLEPLMQLDADEGIESQQALAPNLPLVNLDLPQIEKAPQTALSVKTEQAVASVSVPVPASLHTIVTPEIEAPAPASQRVRLPAPPPPSKTLRESLPEPIANFIFGGNLLVKVGVLILFLGLAFLLRYAAERVTVPIELRYTGVLGTGLVLLALGWRLREKRREYGLSLQGMAIGVFYLAGLSAVKVHQLITPETGFAFLLVVSVLSAALAVLQKAPVLAIVAALEGFASPVLTSTGANRPLGLMTYLAVLDVGIFLVAWFNAWRVLNVIAFVGTFTLSLGWANKFYTPADYGLVQPFLIFFFVLFAVIGVLFACRTLLEARHAATLDEASRSGTTNPLMGMKLVGRVDSALVFGNPLTAFGLQYLLVKHTEYGAAFSALAIAAFYLLLARFIFSKEKHGLALLAEAYVIVAAIFATLAIPLGLEGTWTSAAWAVEAAGMYWLGCRQQRPYARAFAYVVMVGATFKLINAMSINTQALQPLLEGSLLGPVLLGSSALVMWFLHRRRESDSLSSWEVPASRALPWLGFAAYTILPWMLLVPSFASAACAVFALVVGEIGRRRTLPEWRPIAATIQVASVLSFLFGLHVDTSPQAQGFLQDGWRGMLPAIIIALSILLNAGRRMWAIKREAEAQGLPPAWTAFDGLATVTGFALLHLAMLFALDLYQVAAIWPLTAVIVLFGALYMAQTPLAVFALVLQGLSGFLYLQSHQSSSADLYFNWNFATQMSLAIAAFLSADRLRHEAQRFVAALRELSTPAGQQTQARAWLNPWCNQALILWLLLPWGLVWWLIGWGSENSMALSRIGERHAIPAAEVMLATVSALLLLALAAWRRWPQVAKLSAVSLPMYLLAAAYAWFVGPVTFTPSLHWGWLVWPVAAMSFYFGLRKQERYIDMPHKFLSLQHIVGTWLFLFLISAELRAHFVDVTGIGEAWVMLATVAAPALLLFALGRNWAATLWPLLTHRSVYAQQMATPIAALLLLWCWGANMNSAGDASPLPYLPLLNPLELGLCLVLLSLFVWWRHLPKTAGVRLPDRAAMVVMATSAFALLTAGVLRVVHHYAGVAWNGDALFDSRLAQAAVSITWAITGVSLMILGNRRASRTVWIAGAALLAIVVAKLFLIELADRGGLYRIVSFIGVGLAFLVVGYFAPVPVKRPEEGNKAEEEEAVKREEGV
jgi:uncharacterized membrane protein